MRTLWLGVLLVSGCAPAMVVNVRVDPARAATLAETPERAAARTRLDKARAELQRAEADLARAEKQPRTLQIAQPRTPALEAVQARYTARSAAQIEWRRALVEQARWQLACADADEQLISARILSRSDGRVEIAPFEEQQARLLARRAPILERVSSTHAAFEAAEAQLTRAKERYAAAMRIEASAQVTR